MLIKHLPRLLPITLLPLLSCAHVPKSEPQNFTDLLDEIISESKVLIDSHARTVDDLRTREQQATTNAASYPTSFDPESAQAAQPDDPFIQSFHAALAALALYTDAIRAASEGDDPNAIEQGADAAALLLSGTEISSGLPIAGAISALAQFLANARDRARLNDAIALGAAPVSEILDAFVAATPDLYRVHVGVAGDAMSTLAFEQECILAEIERIAAEYAPPPPGTSEALNRARLEADLHALRTEVSPQSTPRALPVGAIPYDATVQQRLEQQLRIAQGLRDQQRSAALAISEYHAKLGNYVRLIAEARTQLTQLRANDARKES